MATNISGEKATGIGYLRVSTQGQCDQGVSLDQQESSIRAYAEQHGIDLLGVYREAALSGKLDVEARPALNQALQAVRETNSVLIVASLSRLARSQRVLWRIVDPNGGLGIPIVSVKEAFETITPFGKCFLSILGAWSQLEADLISDRTKTALDHLKRNGTRLGAPRSYESRVHRRIIVDPWKVRVIRFVQALSKAKPTASQRDLAAYCNMIGLPTPTGRGKYWQKQVGDLLKLKLDGFPSDTERPFPYVLPEPDPIPIAK